MSKAKAIWELTRLEHGLMLCVAILIGALVASQELPDALKFFLAFMTALLIEASTFALNDYYDYEIDKANGRMDRPLVRGELTKRDALVVFAVLFPLGIASSFFVNMTCFLIAVISAVLAVAYDAVLKRYKPVGNLYIAYSMAIPFVFGATATLETSSLTFDIPLVIVVAASVAFLAGVGREAMKDIQDADGDKKMGVRSVATMAGVRAASAYAAVFYIAAIALAFVPFLRSSFDVYYLNPFYIVPVLITDAMLIYICYALLSGVTKEYRTLRKLSLAALFVGLMGFLAGAFLG
jgi:geranylgeranylglycerol-phosphate geranylgeranyltransferase